MFLIKKIYKFLKNFLKNFGYEINIQNIKKKNIINFLTFTNLIKKLIVYRKIRIIMSQRNIKKKLN